MDPAIWLPDNVWGWLILALLVLGLGWWLKRLIPRVIFRWGGARRMARQHGWLVKTGSGTNGDLSPDGTATPESWEATALPGTDIELLGEHRGYIFHARQQRTRIRVSAGTSGGYRKAWRYDYVVSIAMNRYPYGGFFTSSSRQAIIDWRLALYPAFIEWEQPIFKDLSSGAYTPPEGFRSRQGMISTEHRDRRLSKGALLNHLDQLLNEVQPGAPRV
ncbi:hypothetical protein FHU38_004576 [Saccharomonospora amisosensis]|uniref:Uncharacterized protein n=1 Tax=Saccharomonospora amisosensis TaxID=1128677 RepID=A0A7X5ZST2_9PSEU|nr:hypothetical protein [Saccharomonospora amisosensis]NIJ14232.1 hypothetical protein [Saccharomonospora amisosensis]